MSAKNVETTVNFCLGEVLRRKHPAWTAGISAEQRGIFENSSLQPDLAISNPGGLTVVIETEFHPAGAVETEARSRVGLKLAQSDRKLEQAIAVRMPSNLRSQSQADLTEQLRTVEFEYCVFTLGSGAVSRWPRNGWLRGDVNRLAACIEQASLSEQLVSKGISLLEDGIRVAARIVQEIRKEEAERQLVEFGRILHQQPGTQTTRMAMAIIANALVCHEMVAASHDIESLQQLRARGAMEGMQRSDLCAAWTRILTEINYWPIFSIALNLVENMHFRVARRVISALSDVAEALSEFGITSLHDLSGRLFQRMIVDRKFLATFYTRPACAALLSELAVSGLNFDWTKTDRYGSLRIGDFSCGTGTLLSSAYHSVLSRFRRNGGDDRLIHSTMMESSLIAADIMPAATHLTATLLCSSHPQIAFKQTQVYTLPYGTQPSSSGGTVAIGSLDLLSDDKTTSLFGTGIEQVFGDSLAVERRRLDLPEDSMDLVVMNPPFTRPTNHEATDVPVPSFAGFETSDLEQREMSAYLKRKRKSLSCPTGNGNAGLASYFVDLAHLKTKNGGRVAFVLPATFANGGSWKSARDMFAREYREITLVSLASSGSRERAFSADTAIAECLLTAVKSSGGKAAGETIFVNLDQRPETIVTAMDIAHSINGIRCDDRNFGALQIGDDKIGNFVKANISDGGCAGLRNPELAHAMMRLSIGNLSLPRMRSGLKIPTCSLGDLGNRGLVDRDVGERKAGVPPYRAPFTIRNIEKNASYPMLWAHDFRRERQLFVDPDFQGEVRPGCDWKAREVWSTATRLHFNRDFQLNSQSLAACLTPEPSIGGTAWPNMQLIDRRWEEFILLWANSTLGLMSFWWIGTRQQEGRARLTINRLPSLLTYDPRTLTKEQISLAKATVEDLRNQKFLAANEAYRDPVRKKLDRRLLINILQLPEDILESLDLLRRQFCWEPSVYGTKEPIE